MTKMSVPAAAPRPLILVRGFGGPDVRDEQRNAYQGFNDGTVYPGKRGDNYIYEGFVLRALKSDRYRYTDATNVVGYYAEDMHAPKDAGGFPPEAVAGSVVLDPMMADRMLADGTAGTIWVYRYYDLTPRALARYGEGLVRLIDLVRFAAERRGETFPGVDVVAHSMGGLVVRQALKGMHERDRNSAATLVHRVVTLGTPHRGIAFQRIPDWLVERLPLLGKASDEMSAFDPEDTGFLDVEQWLPLDRILTVVGTNYRTYGNGPASLLNRVSSLMDEGSLTYNRSDGLVKQASAQLPGAPRTLIHKCHGGPDSVVTSREAYEIAMRFLHGTHRVKLWLDDGHVLRGGDLIGRSEYYFGVCIKVRYLDFDLFHQSPEAENCYGPFFSDRLDDELPLLQKELRRPLAAPGDRTTGWAGPDRLIWDGFIDAGAKHHPQAPGLVFRLDVYVGERDTLGAGFSDNVIFRKQYYVQAFTEPTFSLFVHTSEEYLGKPDMTADRLDELAQSGAASAVQRPADIENGSCRFQVAGTGFEGIFRLAVTDRTD